MKAKKYLTLTRAGIIEALQFRLSFIVMVIGNILYLIVIYFLWKAIYRSAGTDVVNGMTFSDTLIYLVLATALFNFMEMYIVWEMGRDIQSGKIALNLIRPMEYRNYLFWSVSGSFVVNFVFTFIPTFIIPLSSLRTGPTTASRMAKAPSLRTWQRCGICTRLFLPADDGHVGAYCPCGRERAVCASAG